MYTSYIIQTSLQSTNTEAPGGSVADWLADAGPLGEAPSSKWRFGRPRSVGVQPGETTRNPLICQG